MDIKRVCDIIDQRQDELFSLLSSLIKYNSESVGSHGNEKELAEHIKELCIDLGLQTEMYSPLDIEGFVRHPDYLEGRNLEDRYNVTARWCGEEDADELMLMGHIDTVPVGNIKDWSFDPFIGEVRDGKVFGRGACDDKYALATVLFLIKLLKDEGFSPKKNLLFTAYCDEEFGGSHGALASSLRYPSARVVNLDGRENQIWNCASGGGEMKYFFHTKSAADSAYYAARGIPIVLDVMEEFKKHRRDELEENPYYKGTIIPDTALRYMGIKVGEAGMDLGKGEIHFVFYTVKTAEEIKKELDELEELLKERLEPLGLIGDGFEPATRFFHYTSCKSDCEAIKELIDASKTASGNVPAVCGSCLSDLSIIGLYGGKEAFAYGCGRDFSLPGGAHQPNEFIECASLLNFAKNIAAYVLKTLGD